MTCTGHRLRFFSYCIQVINTGLRSQESVQQPELWGISLMYISNAVIPQYKGWGEGGCTGTDSTSSNVINIPSFNGNWVRTINASPAVYPRSLVCPHIVHSHDFSHFLHSRQLMCPWRIFNTSTDGQNWLVVHTNTIIC